MNPDPVEAGVVVLGTDPAVVDTVCAVLMGFDVECLPIVRQAFATRGWPITTVRRGDVWVVSDEGSWDRTLADIRPEHLLRFRPHFGWEGHVEAQWRGARS